MRKANADTAAGAAFLLFCSFAWWRIKALPLGVGYENTIGPEFFPAVMTAAIAVFSILLIARSLWMRTAEEQGPTLATKSTLLRMGLFIILLTVYVFIYEILGFVLASVIILPAGMFMLGERRLLHIFLFPCILVGLAWLAFTKVMMVPLPDLNLDYFTGRG